MMRAQHALPVGRLRLALARPVLLAALAALLPALAEGATLPNGCKWLNNDPATNVLDTCASWTQGTTLDLSNKGIVGISNNAFAGLGGVDRLILSYNDLVGCTRARAGAAIVRHVVLRPCTTRQPLTSIRARVCARAHSATTPRT